VPTEDVWVLPRLHVLVRRLHPLIRAKIRLGAWGLDEISVSLRLLLLLLPPTTKSDAHALKRMPSAESAVVAVAAAVDG